MSDKVEIIQRYNKLKDHGFDISSVLNFASEYLENQNSHYEQDFYNAKEQVYSFGNSNTGDIKNLKNDVIEYVKLLVN